MLISPPFLPARPHNMTEDAWLALAMPAGPQGHGKFPLSFNLGWHGGVHLEAPLENGHRLPVRAIADGTVVYVRKPVPKNGNKDDPLNYGDVDGNAVWTDKGCVIIKHTTSIGANAAGTETEITFFSIYMHLNQIRQAVQKNKKIYRKDEIGDAGIIYGETNQIHFEIICDDDNLKNIVGRRNGNLATTQDGRTDAVYGNMYFALPSGTPIYAQQPLPHLVAASVIPAHPANTPAPAPQALTAAFTTTNDLYIAMQFSHPVNDQPKPGNCVLTTWQQDSTDSSQYVVVGTDQPEADYEYDLYTKATHIAHAYQKAHEQSPQQTPDVPAASAIYELLRFGRVINTANETLTPANVPHWRKINYPGGSGWVNLNAANVRKFSDADFPQWAGWTIVDDSANQDSRCDSPKILSWIDSNKDGTATYIEALLELGDPDTQKKLGKVVVKFPTEWDTGSIDKRWGWLKTPTAQNPHPLSDDDFSKFKAHANAICFWGEAGVGISDTHWHFHPVEFIRQFRKCTWLSLKETIRILPTGNGVATVAHLSHDLVHGRHVGNQVLPTGMHVALNEIRRKYLITGCLRAGHFFGQIGVESDRLRTANEYANGMAYDVTVDAAKAAELGNSAAGDGPRFKGKGLIQITGKVNYQRYGNYRSKDFTTDPNPLSLRDNAYCACDASGFYWVAEKTRDKVHNSNGPGYHWVLDKLININRRADHKTFTNLSNTQAIAADMLNVTRQVNRAALHISLRTIFFKAAYYALSDEIAPAPNITNQTP